MFGKRKDMTLDELKEIIAALSPEEKQQLEESLQAGGETGSAPEPPAETREEAEGSAAPGEAEAGEDTPEPAAEETEETSAQEETQAPEEQTEPDAPERESELSEAVRQRLDALEEQIGKLTEMINSIVEANENRDFGARADGATEPDPQLGEDEQIMSSYYRGNTRAYK